MCRVFVIYAVIDGGCHIISEIFYMHNAYMLGLVTIKGISERKKTGETTGLHSTHRRETVLSPERLSGDFPDRRVTVNIQS